MFFVSQSLRKAEITRETVEIERNNKWLGKTANSALTGDFLTNLHLPVLLSQVSNGVSETFFFFFKVQILAF